MTIKELLSLNESENRIEFKEAVNGNFPFNGGKKLDPKDRRRCIVGYVTALANECGGILAFGVKETKGSKPHLIVGTKQSEKRLGDLEQKIYRSTGIRVSTTELFDEYDKRVLLINIPSRPFGKTYTFEDVRLMRVGEELRPMSDEQYLKIIQEQEPDFSESICEGVKIEDLDPNAIQRMQETYARKQNNSQFLSLSHDQVLKDLNLVVNDKVTNGALILVGKKEVINKYLPQSSIKVEFRNSEGQITFDNREVFDGPVYLIIDRLWDYINLRNSSIKIQEGVYIFEIPYFNEEVIREAINNAIAHRNYRLTSEIVIKQYPQEFQIISPGGFPIGVTIENLITVPSTPRNRLLTEVLQKTGLVERSGQGIDKIFYQTLKEGKSEPNFNKSDDFQVELHLSAIVEDKAFAIYLEFVQEKLEDGNKLSVHEIIHLNNIKHEKEEIVFDRKVIKKLLDRGLIEKHGVSKGRKYYLSQQYYEFNDDRGKYSRTFFDDDQAFQLILSYFAKFETAKMKDFIDLLGAHLGPRQIKYLVKKLVEGKESKLSKHGKGSATYYTINKEFFNQLKTLGEAVVIGLEQLKKDGKI